MRPGPRPGKGDKISLANVKASYGKDAPDWAIELAKACDASSQAVVARKIGYSTPVISQVLNKKYTGDIGKFQQKVEGLLMNESVTCPVIGEMKKDVCLEHQKRVGLSPTSSFAQIMADACPSCPLSNFGGLDD